jgi:uncharacterized membrane protein
LVAVSSSSHSGSKPFYSAAKPSSTRLAYIDWLRGLACVLMFQTHCYDAWLGGAARNSKLYMWSQILGTFPAPLFLFLAGISFAIVTDKLVQRGLTANQVAEKTILRGAEILGLGLLFRLQEFAIALGWAPWTDLFRVDILNTIGASMILMGVVCWGVLSISSGTRVRAKLAMGAAGMMALIAVLTPLVWTNWRIPHLPWEVESYINGVHNLGQPQAWLFPIFPWGGFAFAGLACGFLLVSDYGKKAGARLFLAGIPIGLVLIYGAKFLDSRGVQLYAVYDFWHTSPNFFVMRVGFLLLFVVLAYGWCRWGWGARGFSPLIQMGNTSLLVYWVHIELVYGRFHILPQRSQTIFGATVGLAVICISMLLLSMARTAWKANPPRLMPWRKSVQAAGSSR